MKKIYTLALALMATLGAYAQVAPVPTSYDFENGGTYPTGWTLNPLGTGTQYYTTSFACGNSAYSLKMDFDNESLVIALASQPGVVSYNIRANTGSTTPFSGTYAIQESVDGSSWVDIKVYNNGQLNVSSCVSDFATPTNPASRYIRFFFTNKTTGNVAIDDIVIAAPVLPVGIKVTQSTVQISNGGYSNPVVSPVSTTTPFVLDIENIGTTTGLDITGATLSGPQASEFVLNTAVPFTVATTSSTPFNIDFTPTASGTRNAVLTLTTNDPNNTSFVVNLYGVGGTLASEPANQATNLTFPINKTYRVQGSFTTAGSAVDALGGYIILRKNGGAVTDLPVDGVTYSRGEYIGTSQVVYAGPLLSSTATFAPSNIRASNTYGFAVITYNGSGSVTNYNTTAPLSQTVTTPFSMMPASEYSTIDVNSASFLTDLSTKINPHTPIFYSNYGPTMIDRFETRDTFVTSPYLFTRVVNCVYSGTTRMYNEPFDWSALDFSREHTYCHNWMPTNPADNPEKPEYNDQHNLYPAKQTNVNAVRSNYPLGEVVNPSFTFGQATYGADFNGNTVFEPRDQHKGNAARAIMYMATCYNGVGGNNWKFRDPISVSIQYAQDQNVLKKWHFEDLPDSYERSRNDFLDSLQGNRNPFIDSVNYACYIDFMTMTKINNPSFPCYFAVGLKENVPTHFEFVLAPNPSSGEFNLMIDAKITETLDLNILDVLGKKVYTQKVNVQNGFNNVYISNLKLETGIYFVDLNYKNEKITRKLLIE